MAINDTGFSFLGFPMGFKRDLAFALDRSSIFYSYEDAVKYAAGNLEDPDSRNLCSTSYVGQIISVLTVSDDTVTKAEVYKIDKDRTLTSLDSMPVDGDAVTIEGGKLSLTGFSAAENGAQPKVVVDGSGVRTLTWFIPDNTTVEGLQTNVQTLQTDVANLKTTVGGEDSGLVKDVSDLKTKADAVDSKITDALKGYVHDATYDADTLKITLPMVDADGADKTLVINLPKDNFVRSGRYDAAYKADEESEAIAAIVLTVGDGENSHEIAIPAASLIDVYTADNTGKKAVTVAVSEDNKISASLELAADTILSINEDGKLTIDTTAIYAAIDAKFDKSKIVTDFSEENIADDTTVASAKAVNTELTAVKTAHNTLKSNFEAHTHNGTDSPKISYNNLLDVPEDLATDSDVENAVSNAKSELTAEINKKQDKVLTKSVTLATASWTENADNNTFIYRVDLDVPENSVINIVPATNEDGEIALNAHIKQVLVDHVADKYIEIVAESAPTADIAVNITVIPSVEVMA